MLPRRILPAQAGLHQPRGEAGFREEETPPSCPVSTFPSVFVSCCVVMLLAPAVARLLLRTTCSPFIYKCFVWTTSRHCFEMVKNQDDRTPSCCVSCFSRFEFSPRPAYISLHPRHTPHHVHQSGKESTLIVERYGGNMMSLHAEPAVVGAGDGPVPPESELSFQTHVMKVCHNRKYPPPGGFGRGD